MSTKGVAELEMTTETEAAERAALEAILFLSVEPVPLAQLAQAVGVTESRAQMLLELFGQELGAAHRGLQLTAVAGGWRVMTKPSLAPVVRRYQQMTSSARLSRAALETLAMVAYKQPVLRTEIEAIRGVDCAGVLKTLLDHRLVKIVGRRDVVGRPIVYGTTREFLEYFGLKDLTELPTLKEFDELVHQRPAAVGDAPSGDAPDGESSVMVCEPVPAARPLATHSF